jgi:hypothetical protein
VPAATVESEVTGNKPGHRNRANRSGAETIVYPVTEIVFTKPGIFSIIAPAVSDEFDESR